VIEELDTPFAWQVGMFFAGFLAALEDDPEACLAYVERGQAAAGELVFPVYEAVLALLSAWARARGGDASATAELANVLGELERSGVLTLSHFFRGLYADAVAATADEESALEAFEDAIATSHRLDERFYLAELRRRRGELLLALGRPEDGRAELEAAVELALEQGAHGLELRARETLAGVAA
jgi:tetratricopeptide (TPR) repeat protein